MNVKKKKIDDLNIQLTINIAADDYAPIRRKMLAERRKTAEFKGFRKGNVPMSLIERVYGEQCLGDAVNELISEQLNKYITDNKLRLIGEPLASEDQPEFEWKDGNDFAFKFDLATAPEVNFDVTKEDSVVYYTIKTTAEAKNEMKQNMLMQFGSLQEVETPGEESYVYADLTQEGGKSVENAYISMRDVSAAVKPALLGVKAGDKLELNINELFEREGDRATLIKVKKEDLPNVNPVFQATVVNIKDYRAAEPGKEAYDKMFGEGKVTTEEDFDKAIAARLADNYRQEADYRLNKDLKDYFLSKAGIQLPEAFLKRWLYTINKDKYTPEEIDKEFDSFLADYRWQMVRDFLMEKYDLKVSEAEVKEAALSYVSYQYAMYGMSGVPEDFIRQSAEKILADSRQRSGLEDQVADQKVLSTLRENVTLSKKSISVEKFRELK